MPSTFLFLQQLSRDELLVIVDQSDLEVPDRRAKAGLADAVGHLMPRRLAGMLETLSRDRLKELCRALELDDFGREKAPLVKRLMAAPRGVKVKRQAARPTNAPVATSRVQRASESTPPPSNRPSTPRSGSVSPPSSVVPGDTMPTPLSDLESHFWESANTLRGSPVDRTDWKTYILPLLFFKRICDVWDEEHAAMLAEYGENFDDEDRFQIPENCHLNVARAAFKNVGTALANSLRGIESADQKHLYGVFGDAQWTNKDRLPDELLQDLLEHFSSLSLGNARVTSDVLGDAYEYLIKQFADATKKKTGEFHSPCSVIRLMGDILDPKEGETSYGSACGTGGMPLAAVAHVRERGNDPRTFFGKLYAQEKNLTTAPVARMNLFLHGIEDFDFEHGDTLRTLVFSDPTTGDLGTFDVGAIAAARGKEDAGRGTRCRRYRRNRPPRTVPGLATNSSGRTRSQEGTPEELAVVPTASGYEAIREHVWVRQRVLLSGAGILDE